MWKEILGYVGLIMLLAMRELVANWRNNKTIESVRKMDTERLALIESRQDNFDSIISRFVVYAIRFNNAISDYTTLKLINFEISNKEIVNALLDYSRNIIEFALDFFYSDFRSNPIKKISESDFQKQLEVEIDKIMSTFMNALKEKETQERAYKVGGHLYSTTLGGWIVINSQKKEMLIKDDPGLYCLNNLLISRFIENNIDENELQKIIINHIGKFLTKFKELLESFKELEDYDLILAKKLE